MLKRVENLDKYKTAEGYYYYLRSDDKDYLFSESQLAVANKRADKNKEDIPTCVDESPSMLTVSAFGFLMGVLSTSFIIYVFHLYDLIW
jgi:hypothetical protein